MSALQDVDYDVVIAGLGPVGAVLAILLGEQGLRVLAVERSSEVYPLPRAVHFDDEIMQLFQRIGIAKEVLKNATPAPGYEFRSGNGEVLMRFSNGAQQGLSGWASSYMFYQPGVEAAIRRRLGELANVEVRIGVPVEAFTDHGGYVEVQIGGAQPDTVTGRYLVGCDGGNSTVRTLSGIDLFNYDFDEPWLVIDVKVDDVSRLPADTLQLCDPKRPITCVAVGNGWRRWEFMLLPGEDPATMLEDATIRELLKPWDTSGIGEIERKAVYTFHGLVARQWRKGRILLAGDAAHQMPPFAGQGLCSGVRAATDLGWKLPMVLREEADECLLDSYQKDREPIVRAYIELAISMGLIVCTLDPDVAARRDAEMLTARAAGNEPLAPPQLPAMRGFIMQGKPAAGLRFPQFWHADRSKWKGMEDDLGKRAWLFSRKPINGAPPSLAAFSLDDKAVAPYASSIAAWLDRYETEAVLVRPDRYVFGTGKADDVIAAYLLALRAAPLEGLRDAVSAAHNAVADAAQQAS